MDANFTKLMIDTANGVNADNFSLADSNTAIRKRFSEILKLPENYTQKQLRRAIRNNKQLIFDVIEDTIEDLRVTGWGSNPFFREYYEGYS